jgi:hypothetical protein
MNLSINPDIWKKALESGKAKSIRAFHIDTGLNEQTVSKFADGTISPQFMEILATYLSAIGYTPATLSGVPINEIFTVKD